MNLSLQDLGALAAVVALVGGSVSAFVHLLVSARMNRAMANDQLKRWEAEKGYATRLALVEAKALSNREKINKLDELLRTRTHKMNEQTHELIGQLDLRLDALVLDVDRLKEREKQRVQHRHAIGG